MKLFSYLDLNFTDKETTSFCETIKTHCTGQPKKWLACSEDGILVECESRTCLLSWEEVKNIMTTSTYREVTLWQNDATEIFNKYLWDDGE